MVSMVSLNSVSSHLRHQTTICPYFTLDHNAGDSVAVEPNRIGIAGHIIIGCPGVAVIADDPWIPNGCYARRDITISIALGIADHSIGWMIGTRGYIHRTKGDEHAMRRFVRQGLPIPRISLH
jgi:hypothetical protein